MGEEGLTRTGLLPNHLGEEGNCRRSHYHSHTGQTLQRHNTHASRSETRAHELILTNVTEEGDRILVATGLDMSVSNSVS
jgi:hypothetical protein